MMETSIDRDIKFKENLLQHDNQTHDKFKLFHRKGGVLVEDDKMISMHSSEYDCNIIIIHVGKGGERACQSKGG